MNESHFTASERIKFRLLAEGLTVSAEAQLYIDRGNGNRPVSSADYASTSGIILRLEDDVWVNAPIALYNPNFVENPPFRLKLDERGLFVEGTGLTCRAWMWLAPAYHREKNRWGEDYNSYAFTHADRVRVSPIEGCAITCTFCDLPYEFRYRRKRVDGIVDAVRQACTDPIQPAHHILISGGTPRKEDYRFLSEVYQEVLGNFKDVPVDIMMVPMENLLDVEQLRQLGVNELSINLEIWDQRIARQVMPRKHAQGRDYYLESIERSAEILGPNRVRSMLIVGLEPMEATLQGVMALAERGAVPVLSPFRPDPLTPLRNHKPPTAAFLEELYLRAQDVLSKWNLRLGPSCSPCTHNTLTLAERRGPRIAHGDPSLV
jgi:hypothetical protein